MKVKKIVLIIVLILFVVAIIASIVVFSNKSTNVSQSNAKNSEVKSSDVIEITDNYFIQQTNDVFYNLNEYIGKKIKMQGLIYYYEEEETGKKCYAVVRNTPGCCGNDGLAGLDIRYEGEYPEENTWVEVEGIMKEDTISGQKIPAIQVTSLKEVEEGTKFVTN